MEEKDGVAALRVEVSPGFVCNAEVIEGRAIAQAEWGFRAAGFKEMGLRRLGHGRR